MNRQFIRLTIAAVAQRAAMAAQAIGESKTLRKKFLKPKNGFD
jgi:hypothetical protein